MFGISIRDSVSRCIACCITIILLLFPHCKMQQQALKGKNLNKEKLPSTLQSLLYCRPLFFFSVSLSLSLFPPWLFLFLFLSFFLSLHLFVSQLSFFCSSGDLKGTYGIDELQHQLTQTDVAATESVRAILAPPVTKHHISILCESEGHLLSFFLSFSLSGMWVSDNRWNR